MVPNVVVGMTEQDFLNLLDEFAPKIQQPGEMTTQQMQEHWGIGRHSTEGRIKKMLEEGRIEEIEGITAKGRRGRFYRIVH